MAKKSLASQATAEPTASTAVAVLPGGLGVASSGIVPATSALNLPWVQFMSSKARNWGDVKTKIPSLVEPDMVLIQPNTDPIKLSPCRFHILRAFQYWGTCDMEGKLIKAFASNPGNSTKEFWQSIILVYLPDGGIVAATCRAGRATCQGFHAAYKAWQETETPAWAEHSAQHKETLRISIPAFRFIVEMESMMKPGQKGGRYPVSLAKIVPNLNASDLKTLAEYQRDEEAMKALQQIVEAHDTRVAEITNLMK